MLRVTVTLVTRPGTSLTASAEVTREGLPVEPSGMILGTSADVSAAVVPESIVPLLLVSRNTV